PAPTPASAAESWLGAPPHALRTPCGAAGRRGRGVGGRRGGRGDQRTADRRRQARWVDDQELTRVLAAGCRAGLLGELKRRGGAGDATDTEIVVVADDDACSPRVDVEPFDLVVRIEATARVDAVEQRAEIEAECRRDRCDAVGAQRGSGRLCVLARDQ